MSSPVALHTRDAAAPAPARASLLGMSVEVLRVIFHFYPDSVRALRVASHELDRLGNDFLQRHAKEIFRLCFSAVELPVYSQIVDCYHRLSVRLQAHPDRIAIEFHLSIPRVLRFHHVSRQECPDNRILSPLEIYQFTDRIEKKWEEMSSQRMQEETSAQKAWASMRRAILDDSFPLRGIPEVTAPAPRIRAWMWMHADPTVLQRVQELELNGLELRGVPLEIGLFTNLQSLTLSGNNLLSLPGEIFRGMGSLQFLSLGHNLLSTLPERLFSGLVRLKTLHLNNNRLESLSEGLFSGLTSLKSLGLECNELTSLPKGLFSGLIHLDWMTPYNNRLETLPEELFQGLIRLRGISLQHNRLRSLPQGLFQGLVQLRQLYLFNNLLCSLPEGLFQGLRLNKLRLENNRLSTLPGRLFQGDFDLGTLLLHGNPPLLISNHCLSVDDNQIGFLREMRDFFNYDCRSSFAGFYQFAAGSCSPEAVREAFDLLPDPTKNALYRRVWIEAGRPSPVNPQWGATHAFDNMQLFRYALKKHVREGFARLSDPDKNAVYGHVYILALLNQKNGSQNVRFDPGADTTQDYFFRFLSHMHPLAGRKGAPQELDFSAWQWGRNHAHDITPRLIDAMLQLRADIFHVNY